MLRDYLEVETQKLSSSEVAGGEQVEELGCSFGRDSLVLVLTRRARAPFLRDVDLVEKLPLSLFL